MTLPFLINCVEESDIPEVSTSSTAPDRMLGSHQKEVPGLVVR